MNGLSKKKLVLFVASLSGGAGRMMAHLASYLSRFEFDVSILTFRWEEVLKRQLWDRVTVHQLKASRLHRTLPELVRYLRAKRPEVLMPTVTTTNLVGLSAVRIAQVPTKVVVREAHAVGPALSLHSRIEQPILTKAVQVLYPTADRIVAISRGVADDLISIAQKTADRLEVIYNPVVFPEIYELGKMEVAHPWLNSNQVPVILAVGRLAPQKDFVTLLKAFSEVRKRRRVRLIVLGEGAERQALEGLAKALEVDDSVSLPGYVENPYAYMAKANLLVLSSVFEGFGNVLVEAMAFGTPVVSTDCVSGPAEILKNGDYGMLVPVGDYRLLARAILATLENSVNERVLRERSSQFDIDTAGAEYLRVLREVQG